MKPNHTKTIDFIRELCKGKTEQQIHEAHEAFERYIALVTRICERLEREEYERNELDTS